MSPVGLDSSDHGQQQEEETASIPPALPTLLALCHTDVGQAALWVSCVMCCWRRSGRAVAVDTGRSLSAIESFVPPPPIA